METDPPTPRFPSKTAPVPQLSDQVELQHVLSTNGESFPRPVVAPSRSSEGYMSLSACQYVGQISFRD